jgi:hypothetical protein
MDDTAVAARLRHRRRTGRPHEDVEHRAIVLAGVGHEPTDPVVPADPVEQGEQFGANAVALVAVLRNEGNLGGIAGAQADVPSYPNDLVGQGRHQRPLPGPQ